MTQPEFQSEFKIISAVMSANRNGSEFLYVITNSIVEFVIYENLARPYLTAKFAIDNSQSFIEGIDFQGTEKIEIEFESTENDDGTSIKKSFIATEITKTVRATEQAEIVYFDAIEDIAFKSTLYNVNKCYTGNIISIVSSMFTEYLDKGVRVSDFANQEQIKVIIPNMTPIDAANWLLHRASSLDGLPFYAYSTLVNDEIFISDIGSIIRQDIINPNYPYLYWQAASQVIDANHTPIVNFTYDKVEKTLGLIQKGAVGAKYNFIDTLTNRSQVVNFNATNDTFKTLSENDYFKDDNIPIHDNAQYEDKSIDEYQSKNIFVVSSNGAFTLDNYSINSLYEEKSYQKTLISNSVKQFLVKSPMSIMVHGQHFIKGDQHYSIGNKARIIFLDTDQEITNAPPGIDAKKSGDYIIHAAKHHFSITQANKIMTSLACTKLSSFPSDITVKDFIS